MRGRNKRKTQGILCLGLTLELVGFILAGAFLGMKLDSFMGHGGLGVLLVEGLFFIIWIYHVVKVFRRVEKK